VVVFEVDIDSTNESNNWQLKFPITILGAGGTSPDQALAATPDAAYGITKSMIWYVMMDHAFPFHL